jgi:hypothetical protein
LMGIDQAGIVAITGWHRYQVDPTSTQRQAAFTARRRSESAGLTETKRPRERGRAERERENPPTPLTAGEILRRVMP